MKILSKEKFSQLFSCIAISCNISKKGPVTLYMAPSLAFNRRQMENLGLRGILSAGVGDFTHQDRIFSARISGPHENKDKHEVLVFSFAIQEDQADLSIKVNSQALSLLLFIYNKEYREVINRLEMDLEIFLQQNGLLPDILTELLDFNNVKLFFQKLRKFILNYELDFATVGKKYHKSDLSSMNSNDVNILSLFNDSASF